jgi:hypothetical protein
MLLPAEQKKFELAGHVKRVHDKATPQFCQAKTINRINIVLY